MSAVVLRFTDVERGVRARLEEAERETDLRSWTLFVARGEAKSHARRDGLIVEMTNGTTGPRSPYACVLSLDFAGAEEPECYRNHRERDRLANVGVLRAESLAVGTYNMVASEARAGAIGARLRPAFLS